MIGSLEREREPTAREKRLEAGTWGVFFVWIGVCLLAPLPWGLWLLGVGVILLGAQLVRKLLDLHIEVFWLVAGSLFLLGGISEVAPFGIDVKLIPLVCIAAGIVLFVRALRRGPPLTASRRDLPGT